MSERKPPFKVHVVPAWVAQLKHHKERWNRIARRDPEDVAAGSMPPTILVGRGDGIEALVVADQVDRNRGLMAAETLFCGFEPDRMIFASEVWMRELAAEDPRLAPHQLQREAQAGSRQVQEAIVALDCDQAGAMTAWRLSFAGQGRSFRWLDVEESRDGFGGSLVDSLRTIMTDATGNARQMREASLAIASELGLDPRVERYHRSRGTLLFLEQQGCLCFDLRPVPKGAETRELNTEKLKKRPR